MKLATAGQLRAYLADIPDDQLVVVPDGPSFAVLYQADEALFSPSPLDRTGDVYLTHEELDAKLATQVPDATCMVYTEANRAPKDSIRVVVLES